MKLRTKFVVFVLVIHLLVLALTFFIFKENKIWFIAAELVVLISVMISWSLYQQIVQPLKYLITGVDAIKDQDFNVKFRLTGKHEVDQLIDVYNQMMDHLRKERTLQEQQHFFLEKLIYTSPTGIIILDYDDQVQQVNPKALKLLELKEQDIIDQPIRQLEHPFFHHIAALQTGETQTVKLNGAQTYKLQKSHFVDRGFSRHFVMIEELTAEILIAEKNVYGKVIRMMAHEVNNTIGPVNSIMDSTLKSKQLWQNVEDEQIKDALLIAIQRNQNLNVFMRNFADLVKLPAPNRKEIDLHQLLRSVVTLMEFREGKKNIKLQLQLSEIPFYIKADEQQLEQVLINIIKNAGEAIENEGVITITTDLQSRKLTITDTGRGISSEDAENLFTPFFSTKKDGQGIGLTLVREILLNHGYDFSLKTIAPGNTAFTIGFN